jgi:uncharacterized protein YkwD
MFRRALATLALLSTLASLGYFASRFANYEPTVPRVASVAQPEPPLPPPQRTAEPVTAQEPPAPPQPIAPKVTPGKTVTVTLSEPPALTLLAGVRTDNDTFYQQLVREVSQGRAVYDPDLGRAAREFVFQYTELGIEPPSDVREFLVLGSGALAGDTVFQHVRTTSEAEAALRKAIGLVVDHPPTGPGPIHVGVGEIFQPGSQYSRHIGVVGTPMPIDLEPIARRIEPGQTLHLTGRIRGHWTGVHALVLRPDGSTESYVPIIQGDRLTVAVPVGQKVGSLDVQFVGEGPEGPGKLVQVRVEVGREPPRTYTTRLAPDEKRLDTADDAAAYDLKLLNEDRAKFSLPALQWDPQLAEIARDHSAEMRDSGFFAHRSPTTGMHTDRLAKAHYRSVASAENLAHNSSVYEAEAGLMHSLGHRRNILDPDVTRVGIGVAGKDDDEGRRRWWITQLFAKPVEDIDAAAELGRLTARIDDRRREGGHGLLEVDDALSAVARTAADTALHGEVQGASGKALAMCQDKGLLHGKLRAWAALLPDVGKLQLPVSVDAGEAKRLGVAVVQDPQSDDGRVAVVLLVAD